MRSGVATETPHRRAGRFGLSAPRRSRGGADAAATTPATHPLPGAGGLLHDGDRRLLRGSVTPRARTDAQAAQRDRALGHPRRRPDRAPAGPDRPRRRPGGRERRGRRLRDQRGACGLRRRRERPDQRAGGAAPGCGCHRRGLRADGAGPAAVPAHAGRLGRSRRRRGGRAAVVSEDVVRILNGSTFVVCDRRGDIEASPSDPTGLFAFDTRFLSRWVLTVDGERLTALSTDDLQYFETRFFLVPGTGTVYVDAKTTVIRLREVADGFREQLTVLNHDVKPAELAIRIDAAADFADLFEVKDALEKRGSCSVQAVAGQLVMTYERETFRRSTTVSSTEPAEVDEGGLTVTTVIEPHGSWSTELHVGATIHGLGGRPLKPRAAAGDEGRRATLEDLNQWVARAPRLTCDWDPLGMTYRRSLVDLAALRYSPIIAGPHSLPAAGLPW